METRHCNTCLSIYGMGYASAFVIKGDTPAFVMGDALTFMIKGTVRFHDGRQNRRRARFMIK
jgi:hypothetical protein